MSMFFHVFFHELTQMEWLDYSLCFETLRGLPNLRILKFIDVEFKYADPFTAVVDPQQRVVSRKLEELTLEETDTVTFGIILKFISALNLQLLSCNHQFTVMG